MWIKNIKKIFFANNQKKSEIDYSSEVMKVGLTSMTIFYVTLQNAYSFIVV